MTAQTYTAHDHGGHVGADHKGVIRQCIQEWHFCGARDGVPNDIMGQIEMPGRCANSPRRDTEPLGGPMPDQRTCSLPDCNRPFYGRDRCKFHYLRSWRQGELAPLPRRATVERFWAKVLKTDTCWLWTGALKRGYGHFYLSRGKTVAAHRFAYELIVNSVPDGLELDHGCKVKRCVNPAHLEPVPHIENSRRATFEPVCRCGQEKYIDATNRPRCRECGRRRNRLACERRIARREGLLR